CVEMDADFSHDPESLPSLLVASAEGADLVIGSRYVDGGSTPKWARYRLMLSRGGNMYASIVLGLNVADSTAGFRVYRTAMLEAMDFESVRADGYGFQIEMTYRARGAAAKISEVPIRFVDRERGESKMSSAIIVEALWMVTIWGLARLGKAFRPRRGN
ncbi:MAG: glycosyltransferase, partial [Actinomycetes bacterium]